MNKIIIKKLFLYSFPLELEKEMNYKTRPKGKKNIIYARRWRVQPSNHIGGPFLFGIYISGPFEY